MKFTIEKVISFLYLVCVTWIFGIFFATSFVLLYKIFSGNYLFGVSNAFSVLDNVVLVFLAIPIFLILKILFWRKNKAFFDKKITNKRSRNLKKLSFIIVLVVVLITFISVNFSNPSFAFDYDSNLISGFWMIMRDFLILIIFPIMLIFFAFDFLIDKDINHRNYNLSDFLWVMILSPILVNFSKVVALMAYDCELVIYYFIKHLIS